MTNQPPNLPLAENIDSTTIREEFSHFRTLECSDSCPVYSTLADVIESHDDLLQLAALGTAPRPNLFLAAVHFLLLSGYDPKLLRQYHEPHSCKLRLGKHFREFCLANKPAIHQLLQTRRVQVNEVKRSAVLNLAFCKLGELTSYAPLATVEIGCSAGLNMLWDDYGYVYADRKYFQHQSQPFDIRCNLRNSDTFNVASERPTVGYRIGIELHPPNLNDPQDVQWLQACIWPSHADRRSMLDNAIQHARNKQLPILAGDALQLLASQLQLIDARYQICVVHTMINSQFDSQQWLNLETIFQQFALQRPLYRLSVEGTGNEPPDAAAIRLAYYQADKRKTFHLGYTTGHVRWIDWQGHRAVPLEDVGTQDYLQPKLITKTNSMSSPAFE